jgi:hypothetical protein
MSLPRSALTRGTAVMAFLFAALHFGRYWHLATSRHVAVTVAIGGKADIGQGAQNVAFDPLRHFCAPNCCCAK